MKTDYAPKNLIHFKGNTMLSALFSLLLLTADSAAVNVATQAPVEDETSAAGSSQAGDEGSRKICKRQPVTGQLQGTKRVCMTADQWKRTQETTQRARR